MLLKKLKPYLPFNVFRALQKVAPLYDLSNANRLAAFLATIDHESARFTSKVENLNYSAQQLRKVWPTRFPAGSAKLEQCTNQPKALANCVYGGRMGNVDPDDGWKYRGRGYIQLTGRDNYQQMATSLKLTIDQLIDYLATDEGAMHVAAEWWCSRDLNRIADQADLVKISKMVNGGTIGLEQRKKLWAKYMSLVNK